MSEHDTDTEREEASTAGTGPEARTENGDRDVREYLLKGALIVLTLFAIVAAFQFYSSATRAIAVWVADRYRPLFQAAFNLAVLLVVGIGISRVVRALST